MIRLIKVLVVLAVLCLAGLAGYAYLGDMSPDKTDIVKPVTLDDS